MHLLPRERRRRLGFLPLACLVLALVLGAGIVANKVSAQGNSGPRGSGAKGVPALSDSDVVPGDVFGAPPSGGAPASSVAKGGRAKRDDSPIAAAPPDAKPRDAKPAPGDAAKDDSKIADAAYAGADASPIDYAVVQTDDEFPPGLSDEEKAAIGTGRVPIHREGPYRSPLAHPRFGGPAHVKVGLVIQDVREFNIQTGGYEGEFFLSLTSDKEMPPVSLSFTNGHEVNAKALVDTPTFKYFDVSGKFTSEIDLRKYPFDTQFLDIEIEDERAGVDQIVFEADPNRTSLDSSFRLSSYSVASVGAQAFKHKYPPRFDRDDLYVSRYVFRLGIDRFATSAAFSVYVPALIIVIISLMGLWVPPDELEVRSNAGAPMLAAAVLFHYSLIQALPATGYLTRADKLMLGVYVALLLNMASTWLLLVVDEEGVHRVFRRARAWVPPLTAVVMTLSVLL